ncbi:MAG: four-carbon acid sugar kinase family protein [Ktedonobacteraceae bacterium]
MVTVTDLLAHLPPEPDQCSLFGEIQQAVIKSKRKLVVIDDDPTGTQTVHDVELLTTWNSSLLTAALRADTRLFYLLTNSRSMPQSEAATINHDIAELLSASSQAAQVDFVIASRSDSTLRGHYPAEIAALEIGISSAHSRNFDGHLLVPAFFEGGRYTINDTHYVATPTATSDTLLPAHETPFARDPVFGYKSAYLPDWIEEKSSGRWQARQVVSIGLDLIRQGGAQAVAERLQHVSGGTPIIINAAGYGDLAVVVLGLLQAEAMGKRFLYRTAASFVRVRGAVESRPLLKVSEIVQNTPGTPDIQARGGIVIVGSYVPDSSKQLEHLLNVPEVVGIELPVERVIGGEAATVSREVGQQLEGAVKTGRVGVVYTSRRLITGANPTESLDIGKKVSAALIAALHEVTTRPRFIIAKGGITSHDVAQKGLGAERALVLGQLAPGVPVWRLESGPQSRFAGVPYIVFPGNVGGPESLGQAVRMLSED